MKLDLRDLRQRGLFRADGATHEAVQQWTREGSATPFAFMNLNYRTEIGDSWLCLEYVLTAANGENVHIDDVFDLVPKEQPFGGHRWYIQCPDTMALCKCLYLSRGATRFSSRFGFAQPLK